MQSTNAVAAVYLEYYKVLHGAATFAEYAIGHVTRLVGDKLVVDINDVAAKGYQIARLNEGAAAKSVNEEVTFLLRLMGDAGDALRVRLRRDKALKLKVSQNVAHAFKREQKDKMLALAEESSAWPSGSRAIYAFPDACAAAGMRDADIRNLTWAHVDFKRRVQP